jgi:hypothetical protein
MMTKKGEFFRIRGVGGDRAFYRVLRRIPAGEKGGGEVQCALTWVEIVNQYLKINKYDCLKSGVKKCYCKVNDLFSCTFDACTFDCVAGNIKELSGEYSEFFEKEAGREKTN